MVGTLKQAIAKINALPTAPNFILHTGDLSHLSEPEEFDTLDQMLKITKAGQIFYVPGEHDVISDGGKEYRARYEKGAKGNGWFSFDQKGVHFIGLVGLLVGLAVWRLVVRESASRRASGWYLVLVTVTAAAMMGAGYWGGEMIIHG